MADSLPQHNREMNLEELLGEAPPVTPEEIVQILAGYKSEAKQARASGPTPRDDIWRINWDRYWLRYDSSDKAAWQSTHVMPEAPQYVDRWAAAMREALDAAGGDWFTAVDDTGQASELTPHINKLMKVILSRCAIMPDGRRGDFTSVFEDQMKLGALMTCSASVTWKETRKGGWPTVESVDPREVWKDPRMRDLYRLRSYEIDHFELMGYALEEDDEGEPLYEVEVVEQLAAQVDEERRNDRERSTGTGQGDTGKSKPIVIDEWLCNLVDAQGELIAQNALILVANDQYLIRGPEENPFWHQEDWLVTTAMVPVPFSVYGRSYMEDWGDVADAFVELTNLILDGVFTSTLKAFAANPSMLQDPTQLTEGIAPNTIYLLAEDTVGVKDFMREIDLGTLPQEAIAVWTALKQEMRDGAKLSEIALGQVPPKGDITATEINQVSQSGSAMVRSMARTIEARFLEPVLTLLWQVALQHMDFMELAKEIGEDTARMLDARRAEFSDRQIKFSVRGISGLVDRQTKLRSLLSMLQVIGQNEILLQAFLERTDANELISLLFQLFGIDPEQLRPKQKESMIRDIIGGGAPGQPAQQQPRAPSEAQA